MKKKCKKDFLFVAFGVGCVFACCLPTVWVARLLAVLVMILGLVICFRK